MKRIRQENYFPIIVLIHLLFWSIDLYFYDGTFTEVDSDTMFFGRLQDVSWQNGHRIVGEIFSSWVVTVFAFNFLMVTRAKWVEKLFGGLDKMYLIHRRSGAIAIVLLIGHFLIVPRGIEFTPGKPLGFFAFLLIVVGVFLAAAPPMKKKIPYHKWLNFHKMMGIFYLMAVVHGFLVNSLIKELPITRVYVFGMAIIGVIAWVYRAFFYGFFNKKLEYAVQSVKEFGDEMSEVILNPKDRKLAYAPGQFAFFTFPDMDKREQHPFTISSSPNSDSLRLSIKGLGDYTGKIHSVLKEGDTALVEGPFGHFTKEHCNRNKQVWIAGGIGITPFLAMASQIQDEEILLVWSVKTSEEAIYSSELEKLAEEKQNFTFLLWESSISGHLELSQLGIVEFFPADFLVCGPELLKKSMFEQLKMMGCKSEHLHDEDFCFR